MTYSAVLTALGSQSHLKAFAFSVVVVPTNTGAVYSVLFVVGVVPSVV